MRSNFKYLWFLLSFSAAGLAQGRLLPPPSPSFHHPPLELQQVSATVTIEDQIATTRIQHRFYNPGRRWEEATFIYPLPKGAHITSFEMVIQGKPTQSELLDAKKARGIYEEIVRSMRDPALLESMGSDLLKARVFPIEAHQDKVITLTYQEVLTPDGGLTSYRLPFYSQTEHPHSAKTLLLEANLKVSQGLKTLWSPSHAMEFQRQGSHLAKGEFQSQSSQDMRSFELYYSQSDAALDVVNLTHNDAYGRYFLLQITPQLLESKVQLPPKDLIFILDTSGSMAGEKISQAKQALTHCLQKLRPQDRFAIIRFSTDAEAFAPTLRNATESELSKAYQFLESFEALGGTHMEAAFSLAKSYQSERSRSQVTLFITDGKPTIGERDQESLINLMAAKGSRIFPVGLGADLNTFLLDALASRSGTPRTYINNQEDLEFKISQLYSKVSSPVMTNPQLKVEGVRVQQLCPTTLPDLYRDQTLLVMGTYQGQGTATISLDGDWAGKKQHFQFQVKFPYENKKHPFLPALWATRRVGFLLDQIRLHGEAQELKDEIVILAKRYGLITPYTSHLILEDQDLQPSQATIDPLFRRLGQGREEARRNFEALRQDSGDDSVLASKAIQGYSQTQSIAPSPEAPAAKPGMASMPMVLRANRLFLLENGTWMESHLTATPAEETILIFGSRAYFEFAHNNPELRPILSLGESLVFQNAGKIYRILPS